MQICEMSDNESLFLLSSLTELGYCSKRMIYERIRPVNKIFEMDFDTLKTSLKLSEKQIRAILSLKLKTDELHEEYLSLSDRKIRFILPFEDDYPQKLLNIRDYPFGIFVKGDVPQNKKSKVYCKRACTKRRGYYKRYGAWGGYESS